MWNMDETMMASNKKFKVLTFNKRLPLTSVFPNFPHMTACITINASGFSLKPLVIIPNKKSIKSLEGYSDRVHLCSSTQRWMNKNLFSLFTIIFISDALIYRLMLPKNLRNETMLLIVDGRFSRLNYFVSGLLKVSNILMFVLPGHCSHLLQPLDVAVASPLKTSFNNMILIRDDAGCVNI